MPARCCRSSRFLEFLDTDFASDALQLTFAAEAGKTIKCMKT
jgi:hypothetical protein